jgi:hypothetical protein
MNCLYFIVKLTDEERRPTGPFKLSQVLDQLKGGLIHWSDLAWSPHQKESWRRLYEFTELQTYLPRLPDGAQLQRFTEQCKAAHADATSPQESALKPPFYLHVIGSERGPFSLGEVRDLLAKAKFDDQVYIWCKGLQFWLPIQEIPEFAHLKFANSRMTRTRNDVFSNAIKSQEGRASNREGLVATAQVTRTAGGPASFGICLDGSASGLQVRLEDAFPLAKDEVIDIELMPLALLKLPQLRCKARVAWYKEETLCFGAEFVAFERDGWEKLKAHFR